MKTTIKIIITTIVIVLIGTVSGVLANIFLLPWLSSWDSLKENSFIKKANERVTIINKTEQITVKEDFSVTQSTERVLSSVVSIINYQEEKTGRIGQLNIKSSFDIQAGIKTGVMITSDGLIVSVMDEEDLPGNKHMVLASDGKEYEAQLVTVDSYSRLAFYKISANNLPVAPFGNSDELIDGEKLVVVGNAGGEYRNTFSLGIIREKNPTFSLLNSRLSSSEMMEGALLLDAEINHANVGGPAIDFNGTLMGIAGSVLKDGKDTGYVMPINQIKKAIDRVIEKGVIERAGLGLYYLSINREIALLNNLPVNQGALVYSFSGQQGLAVIKGSAADLAGVRIGDIIVEVSGEKVDLNNPLSKHISQHQPGEEIELKILRAGKEIILKAVLK